MIILSKEVELSNKVGIVGLPENDDNAFVDKIGTVAGWGQTETGKSIVSSINCNIRWKPVHQSLV